MQPAVYLRDSFIVAKADLSAATQTAPAADASATV